MSTERRQLFLEGPLGRALFTLALPIIAANTLQTAYSLTDAFWVGRLGKAAVAAVSVSFPVTFVIVALGLGLAIAGATLTAQYMGAGRQDMVDHVAGQTLLMVALSSGVLGTAGYLVTPYLLSLLGVEPAVFRGALGYMHVSFVGMFFVFIYAMFQALMRGVGQTKIPLFIVLGTVLLNLVLDPLFIFGWGPLKAHGVMGAAMATVGTQGLAAAIGVAVLIGGRHGIHMKLEGFKPDLPFIKKAFFLGLPGSIEMAMRGAGPMVLSFLAASFGTLTLAAFGVGGNVLQFILIPALGLSMGVSTLVGQNIGAGNIDRAARVARMGSLWGFGILSGAGVVAFAFAPHIIAFFVPNDPDVIALGAHFVRIMCLAWGGVGVQLSIIAAFRASGNMLTSMMIAVVSQWVLQFPTAYMLSKHTHLGADGIWWSYPVSTVLMTVVAVLWFLRGDWKKTRLTDDVRQVNEVTDEAIVEDPMRQ